MKKRPDYDILIKFIEEKQEKARRNKDVMNYEIIRQILEQMKEAKEKGIYLYHKKGGSKMRKNIYNKKIENIKKNKTLEEICFNAEILLDIEEKDVDIIYKNLGEFFKSENLTVISSENEFIRIRNNPNQKNYEIYGLENINDKCCFYIYFWYDNIIRYIKTDILNTLLLVRPFSLLYYKTEEKDKKYKLSGSDYAGRKIKRNN